MFLNLLQVMKANKQDNTYTFKANKTNKER